MIIFVKLPQWNRLLLRKFTPIAKKAPVKLWQVPTNPPFTTHKNTPQPPKTLWPPQGASFRPLYDYKYSIFLWVTCSYRKERSLKSNERLVAPCQALLVPALACSTYICILANTPRSHPPTTGKKLGPSPHRKRTATKRTARKLY